MHWFDQRTIPIAVPYAAGHRFALHGRQRDDDICRAVQTEGNATGHAARRGPGVASIVTKQVRRVAGRESATNRVGGYADLAGMVGACTDGQEYRRGSVLVRCR